MAVHGSELVLGTGYGSGPVMMLDLWPVGGRPAGGGHDGCAVEFDDGQPDAAEWPSTANSKASAGGNGHSHSPNPLKPSSRPCMPLLPG